MPSCLALRPGGSSERRVMDQPDSCLKDLNPNGLAIAASLGVVTPETCSRSECSVITRVQPILPCFFPLELARSREAVLKVH
ncbi:hypothetical protein E2C01_042309 [Portunus trituberculatus]|uniref:Uncharacterized protein n=1 Tax=Portunus trituberculatus TaxID=210409 RepID=A0A5B7FSQ7_PORTR|nr:hypothetical protein [Portunus trituberculatus]